MQTLLNDITSRTANVAVIGLGYVGLPLAILGVLVMPGDTEEETLGQISVAPADESLVPDAMQGICHEEGDDAEVLQVTFGEETRPRVSGIQPPSQMRRSQAGKSAPTLPQSPEAIVSKALSKSSRA